MRRLAARVIGCALGVAMAAGVAALVGRESASPVAGGRLVADCGGSLRELVIQYVAGADFAGPIYRQFLGQLPAVVRVQVMCPGPEDYAQFTRHVGPVNCELVPLFTGHAMTPWSRDRWLALRPVDGGGSTQLISPREEAGAAIWPGRAGDAQMGSDLAGALGGRARWRRSALAFDGGDFVTDGRVAFVAPGALRRNTQRTVEDADGLRSRLERMLGLGVVLLDEAPDHHAGMFMMPAGEGVMLVGDPSLARGAPLPELPGEADFSPETQRRFDAVAEAAASAGYRIVRIPTAPAADGKTYITYVNVIMDERDGGRMVYMPVFDGAEQLNEEAAGVWRSLGYEVRPVNCTRAYRHGGSLRCLVNVLERG